MSAAEKLRALMGDERWKSHDSTVLAGLALEFYGTSGHGALPQIVSVVEAAECGHALMKDVYGSRGGDDTDVDVWEWLDGQNAALAALDEALT